MPQAGFENPLTYGGTSGANHLNNINCFVRWDSTDDSVVLATNATDDPDGILQNTPEDNAAATVNVFGVLKLVLAGTVAVGDHIVPDPAGKGVKLTTGRGFCKALSAGVSGETISVRWLTRRPNEGLEVVSAAGALSVFTRTTLLSITGTVAYTLASGRYTGQRKTIRCTVAASTPAGTIAGAFITDGTATTSAALNAIADQLELEWNGAAWQVLANASVTLT